MKPDLAAVWEKIRAKPNVIGYSQSLKPRIRNGKIIEGTQVMRIYVSEKKPAGELMDGALIPPRVNGIETDIVETGTLRALPAD